MFLRYRTIFCPQSQTKHGEAAFSHYAPRRKAVAPTLTSFKSRLKTSLFDAAFDIKTTTLGLYCLLSQASLKKKGEYLQSFVLFNLTLIALLIELMF